MTRQCTREAATERRRRADECILSTDAQKKVLAAAQQRLLRDLPRLGESGWELAVPNEATRCAPASIEKALERWKLIRCRRDPEHPPIILPEPPEETAENLLRTAIYRQMRATTISADDRVAIRDIFSNTAHFVLYAHELMYADELAKCDPKFRRADGMLSLVCNAHGTVHGVRPPNAKYAHHSYRCTPARLKVIYGSGGPLSYVDAAYSCQFHKCPAVLQKYSVSLMCAMRA